MEIIVLIKQVPDIEKVRFDAEKGRIDRSSAPAETNPFDLNALEAAIQLKEKLGGATMRPFSLRLCEHNLPSFAGSGHREG